jgi:hypothetical protein
MRQRALANVANMAMRKRALLKNKPRQVPRAPDTKRLACREEATACQAQDECLNQSSKKLKALSQ